MPLDAAKIATCVQADGCAALGLCPRCVALHRTTSCCACLLCLRARCCLQGSLLSIGVVFVNMSVFSLKQHLKNAVRRLENQLLRDAAPHQQAQAAAAAPAGQVAAPAFLQAAGAGAPAPPSATAAAHGEAGVGPAASAVGDLGAAARAGMAHGIAQGSAAGVVQQDATAATSSAGVGSSSGASAAPVAGGLGATHEYGAGPANGQQQLQQHPQHQPAHLQQQPTVGDALVAAAAGIGVDAVAPGADEAMLAAAAAVGAVADPGGAADAVPPEAADVWGDVPIEELLGLQVRGAACWPLPGWLGCISRHGSCKTISVCQAAGWFAGSLLSILLPLPLTNFPACFPAQGPWVDFVEMVVLLLAGNASFMAGCVYLPLNIGRLMLMAIKRASTLMTQVRPAGQTRLSHTQGVDAGAAPSVHEVAFCAAVYLAPSAFLNVLRLLSRRTASSWPQEQQQLLLQVVSQHVRLPFVNELLAFTVSFLSTHLPAMQDSVSPAAGAAASAVLSTAAAVAAEPSPAGGVMFQAVDGSEPVSLLPLNLDLLLKELQAQMELPARADFVALSMGHALLGLLLLVGLWLYVSMRLWRAARRRLQATGRRPLLQVMRSTGCWLLSAATMVYQGSKLVLLLSLELGAFPVFAGLWLDFCALPLTASSVGQRSELLAKAPVISALMHWVIGVGFVLAFTFLLCVLREVLRPGALPFIKDPTNPERNPVREMLEEPLLRHLGRVGMSWLVYAGARAPLHNCLSTSLWVCVCERS